MFILGKLNECPQGKLFDIRDHIQSITNNVPDEPSVSNIQSGSNQQSGPIDQSGMCRNEASHLLPVNETKLENVIKNLPAMTSCPTLNRENAARDTSLLTFNARKRRIMGDTPFNQDPWETVEHFDPDWFNKIKTYQKDLLPKAEIMENRNWFTYLYNAQDPKKSRFGTSFLLHLRNSFNHFL